MTDAELERLARIADSLQGNPPMALNARDARWMVDLARRLDKEYSREVRLRDLY